MAWRCKGTQKAVVQKKRKYETWLYLRDFEVAEFGLPKVSSKRVEMVLHLYVFKVPELDF